MAKKSPPQYQREYKDQKRVVVYVDPIDKETLAQEALDRGVSLSALVEPSLRSLAKRTREKRNVAG